MQQMPGIDLLAVADRFKNSYDASRQRGLQEQDRLQKLQIGQQAATGDFKGAASEAFKLGDLGTGTGMLQFQQGQDQAAAKTKADQQTRLAGALFAADTPEKWARVIQYAKGQGIPVDPQEENFANRDAFLGQIEGIAGQQSQANSDRTFNQTQTNENRTYNLDVQKFNASQKPKPAEPFTLGEGQIRYDANGNKIASGGPKTENAPPGFRWGPPDETGNPTLVPIQGGKEDLTNLIDPSTIEAMANNKIKPPSPGRNPGQRAMIMKEILKVNPKYDETKYEARQKQADNFAAGPLGATTRSLGVGVAHLEVLQGLGEALQNGDVQMVNAAKQEWAKQFGGAAPVSFDAAKAIVADEIAKGVIGGQNAQSDREALAASVQRASSPEQLKGVVTTFEQLMGGQLGGLRQQYQSVNPGATDFDERFLAPETSRILSQFSGGGDQGAPDPALENALKQYQ